MQSEHDDRPPVASADRPDSPAADRAPRTVAGEPLVRLLLVSLVFLVLAAATAATVAIRVKGISPFDEQTHADYAYQISHGHIPAKGAVLAPQIRADIICHGSATHPGPSPIPCGEQNPPQSLFGGNGEDYAFGHPPLYYLITGVIARAVVAVSPISSFITAARLVGVLWLAAAMVVLFLGLRRFGVGWPVAFCGGALLAFAPAIFYQDATVTNDAAAALCGAGAVWLAARLFVDGRRGWVLPGVLALLAAATKILNAMPFLALALVAIIVALRGWRADRQRGPQLLLVAVSMVVGVLLVYGGWTVFQNHRGVANWVNPIQGVSSRPVVGHPFDELFATMFSGALQLSQSFLPAPLQHSDLIDALLRLWGPLSFAAAAALLLRRELAGRFELGATTLLGVLSVAFVVELQVYVSSGDYFPVVTPRYGISFIPLFLAAMALVAHDNRLTKTMIGFTAVAAAIGLLTVA